MREPETPKALAARLARHNIRLSHALGQNFLTDPEIPQRIAQAAGLSAQGSVLEIGPGVGALTRHLAQAGGQVLAVELDRRLIPLLQEEFSAQAGVTILQGDILSLSIPELCRQYLPQPPRVVCANLPYQITTPVLTALLQSGCFSALTVMVQREVAQRICATAGSRTYGAFSVFCRYYAAGEILFDVPPTCFLPPPKVTSSVLRLNCMPPPVPVEDTAQFFRVVRGAFAQRRKTLVNSLSSVLSPSVSRETITQAVLSLGHTEKVRGEALHFAEFASLAKILGEK